jgi:endo-1,4-beta-xylanase
VAALAGCGPASGPTDSGGAAQELAGSNRSAGCGVTDPTLAELAEPRDISMGTAYRSTFAEGDRCYRDVALAEFDSVTTEIGTMMNTVQPAPGVFDFEEADAIAQRHTFGGFL